MAEQIISLLNKISAIKGEEYVRGLVDGINLASPDAAPEAHEREQEVAN